jgi:hypothetical protein
MRADVVRSVNISIDIGDAYQPASDCNFFDLSTSGQITSNSNPYKAGPAFHLN